MTQLDRSVAPAIRQLEHFSILQPELHRMKNGMPLYVLSAGNEDVIRFDLLVRSGQLDQSQPLQAVFTNRMLREGNGAHDVGRDCRTLGLLRGVARPFFFCELWICDVVYTDETP